MFVFMLRVLSVCLSVSGCFLLDVVELLPFLLGSCLVSWVVVFVNQWKCSPSRLVSLGRGFGFVCGSVCNTCVGQLGSWFIFILGR